MTKTSIFFIIFLLLIFGVFYTFRTGQCYDITRGDHFTDMILLNKCNGLSWMLVKSPVSEKSKSFTYRWYPIYNTDDEAELVRD